MAYMSVDSLRNNLTNPARGYLWEALIPNPPSGDSETMLLRCVSASLPSRSFGAILIPFKQSAGVKFPGKLTYDHIIDLTFLEGEDRAMFDAFYEWCNTIVNDKTGVGSVSVKTDIYLHLLNTDGEVALKIRLVGCYPERMSDVPLDMGSEAEMRFTIGFSFDRWEKG